MDVSPLPIEEIERHVREVPDFPSPGISFKDITPLIEDGPAFHAAVDRVAAATSGVEYDRVLSAEARGFVFGTALAYRARKGLILARKPGKLPRETISASYDLEYGSATIEVQTDAVTPGANVLVVDDVLATGGTAVAACELIEKVGGRVACLDVLVELAFLPGRERLDRWELHTGLVVN